MSSKINDISVWFAGQPLVKASSIESAGLYLDRDLQAGESAVRLGGNFFDAAARHDEQVVVPSTIIGLADSLLLAKPAGIEKDASDAINHSCESNLGMLDAITLVAKRDISRTEELTCDYAYWETDPSYVMKQSCLCGSARCRRRVTGSDWLLEDKREDLLLWASPFIRRRIEALYK